MATTLREFIIDTPAPKPLDKLRKERDKKIIRTKRVRRLIRAGIAVVLVGIVGGVSCGVYSMMEKSGSSDDNYYKDAPVIPSP